MKMPTRAQQLASAQAAYFALQDRSRKKPRRKLGLYEHKGVAYYDRKRIRQPLPLIVHPCDFTGWSTPLPSWIDPSWTAPDEGAQPVTTLDDPPIAETADYTLYRCHVVTGCNGRRVFYPWELTFADGSRFRFVSRAIAEAALSELLKIRKAKHPHQRFGKHSPESECVFFTDRKLRKLIADLPCGTTGRAFFARASRDAVDFQGRLAAKGYLNKKHTQTTTQSGLFATRQMVHQSQT